MSGTATLDFVALKTLHNSVSHDLVAYCPSMELVALGAHDKHLFIFRSNGQRVYGAGQKTRTATLEPRKLAWKPNGQLLAAAWSDGIVRLLDPESSKVAHQISAVEDADGDDVQVTCLAWSTNLTLTTSSAKGVKEHTSAWKQVIEEEKRLWVKDKEDEVPLNLPSELALLDIEPSLPKISPLPSEGTIDDVFSTRASLDTLFRVFDRKANEAVDVLIVGTSDGRVHLSIFDSFIVGSFPSPIKALKTSGNALVAHASHEACSMHGLLVKSSSNLLRGLSFVPMDLRFITSSKDYLSLLASRSTALQNLLRYTRQVQTLMATEFHAGRDLPSKFLRNVNEALEETAPGWSIVSAFYHQVLTGHMLPQVAEWLGDVGERGYKRWDKAVTTSLNSLRTLIHKKLIPTLTRIALICSRLHGLALYHAPTSQAPSTLGFSAPQISLILDTTACLTLVAEHMLTAVVEEIDTYTTFSEWFKNELLRSEKSPTDEQLEKEANINHAKVLDYIQNSLTDSKLGPFFGKIEDDKVKEAWAKLGETTPLFESLTETLRNCEGGRSYVNILPNLSILLYRLEEQSGAVFQQIAEAEKRNVIFGSPVDISEGKKDGPIVMRMLVADGTKVSTTYVSQIGPDGKSVQVHRLVYRTQNGVSSLGQTEWATVTVGEEVKDISFLDDEWLLLLFVDSHGNTLLSRINFTKEAQVLNFHLLKIKDLRPICIENMPCSIIEADLIGDTVDFVPEKLHVSNSGRIVVLSKGGSKYKVFTINEEGLRDADSMIL